MRNITEKIKKFSPALGKYLKISGAVVVAFLSGSGQVKAEVPSAEKNLKEGSTQTILLERKKEITEIEKTFSYHAAMEDTSKVNDTIAASTSKSIRWPGYSSFYKKMEEFKEKLPIVAQQECVCDAIDKYFPNKPEENYTKDDSVLIDMTSGYEYDPNNFYLPFLDYSEKHNKGDIFGFSVRNLRPEIWTYVYLKGVRNRIPLTLSFEEDGSLHIEIEDKDEQFSPESLDRFAKRIPEIRPEIERILNYAQKYVNDINDPRKNEYSRKDSGFERHHLVSLSPIGGYGNLLKVLEKGTYPQTFSLDGYTGTVEWCALDNDSTSITYTLPVLEEDNSIAPHTVTFPVDKDGNVNAKVEGKIIGMSKSLTDLFEKISETILGQ